MFRLMFRQNPKEIAETGVWVEHNFETYREHGPERYQNLVEHGRNIPRARSKHTSSTVETYLEHGRNIPIAPRYFGIKNKNFFQI